MKGYLVTSFTVCCLSWLIATINCSSILSRDDIACSEASQPRVLNDPSGTFTSQNYPADYVDNANCQWLIVAQPGQLLWRTFTDNPFHSDSTKFYNFLTCLSNSSNDDEQPCTLQGHYDCKRCRIINLDFDTFNTERGYDRVWIYDGDSVNAPVILGLDGARTPAPANIHSSQGNMFVIFTSDTANVAAGFSATYTSIDPEGIEDACSLVFRPRIFSTNTAYITSQFFPDPYPFGSVCEWLFVSQSGIVQLDFGSFFTEPNADWVTIFDGASATAPVIGRLSGAYTPAPSGFRTTQESMFVRFTSDLAVSVRGFNATFTAMAP